MLKEIDPGYWIAPALNSGNTFLEPMQGAHLKMMGVVKPWAPPRSYGLVIRLDDQGLIRYSLHSRFDGKHHGIVAAVERAGRLYLLGKGRRRLLRLSIAAAQGACAHMTCIPTDSRVAQGDQGVPRRAGDQGRRFCAGARRDPRPRRRERRRQVDADQGHGGRDQLTVGTMLFDGQPTVNFAVAGRGAAGAASRWCSRKTAWCRRCRWRRTCSSARRTSSTAFAASTSPRSS